ncbi:MAG: Glu/Leu/Phe/Val dehydrogenase [Candidatus Micrarchaeia archaeon]|jgi:glutamate dehydrogenase/leucine dehydrogenase
MEFEHFIDKWGPEKILCVYDQATGMRGVTVIDNTAIGPGKGGIRMQPDVTVQEVFRLARAMTWKNALAQIPFGGAKSGIMAAPANAQEKEMVMRAFARSIKPVVPSLYVAGPDMRTTELEMKQFCEEIGTRQACTGKPTEMGGLPHELGSTGFGVAEATEVALEFAKIPISGATVAIEGFGNVGTFASKFLSEKGAKIVAVSDSKGTIYNPAGLDVAKLEQTKAAKGTVTAYDGAGSRVLAPEELFTLQCDVLIPGARPDAINQKNVNSVRAKLIVEAANLPISEKCEKNEKKCEVILTEKKALIVPDVIANAGGVISSYIEFIGGTKEQMFQTVREKIRTNTKLVLETSQNGKITPREAALGIAQERVLAAMMKKGLPRGR